MSTGKGLNPASFSDVQYEIQFPANAESGLEQDEEWCDVTFPDGEERRIRFHDYHEIFPHQGLYEQIFHERLRCSSPTVVCTLLDRQLAAHDADRSKLAVLDLGAGNGMVGGELRALGAGTVVGVDLIAEAGAAAERDRPGVYDDYLVGDLCELEEEPEQRLRARRLNALTCVAALGFGDIPPLAFATAYDLVAPDGWLAFNLREEFLEEGAGFAELIRALLDDGSIETLARERYVHRLAAADREPLHYVALIARKRSDASARERVGELELV